MGPPDGKGNGNNGNGGDDSTSLNIVTFNETPNKAVGGKDIVFADISFADYGDNLAALGFTLLAIEDHPTTPEEQAELYMIGEDWYSFSHLDSETGIPINYDALEVGGDPEVGDDSLWGNEGDDFLFAGSGNDLIYFSEGTDYIDGGSNDDYDPLSPDPIILNKVQQIGDSVNYNGSATGDSLTVNLALGTATFFWEGSDILTTQTLVNIESIRASKGNDTIIGDDNHNSISGQAGDDYINGGGGNDFLIGHFGTDTINGGTGDDFLTGGWDPESGKNGKRVEDIFEFGVDSGEDTITDFNPGVDKIDLQLLDISWGDIIGAIIYGDGDAEITLSDGNVITLWDVSMNSLQEDDFIFAPPPDDFIF